MRNFRMLIKMPAMGHRLRLGREKEVQEKAERLEGQLRSWKWAKGANN